jgi:hypothetical protein
LDEPTYSAYLLLRAKKIETEMLIRRTLNIDQAGLEACKERYAAEGHFLDGIMEKIQGADEPAEPSVDAPVTAPRREQGLTPLEKRVVAEHGDWLREQIKDGGRVSNRSIRKARDLPHAETSALLRAFERKLGVIRRKSPDSLDFVAAGGQADTQELY